jgi:hypothetical protein
MEPNGVINWSETLGFWYTVVVGTASFIGALKGTQTWYQWWQKRQWKHITYQSIEPVVNVSCDTGVLAWHVTTTAVLSGLVAGTAPVSVPLLLWKFQKDN